LTSSFSGDGAFGLLFLASSALPTGSFAWSQGLEAAATAGLFSGPKDLENYLNDVLMGSLAYFDLPLLNRAFLAATRKDEAALLDYSLWILAGRETRELFQAEKDMGRALGRLIKSLGPPAFWGGEDLGYLAALALLAATFFPELKPQDLAKAFAYGFLENQLAAASRLSLVSQTEARRIILALKDTVFDAVQKALSLPLAAIGSQLINLAIFSSRHETQEARLFRS
jgi:urease accessory protein